MGRLVSITALALLVALSVIVTMIVLAYGFEPDVPSSISIAGMESSASIAWDDEYTLIEADDEPAFFTALGHVHGVRRAWPALLWRQIALGQLSAWYGADVAEIDSLTFQLGLRSSAREAFRNLSQAERELLRSYSDGFNAAIQRRSIRLQDEFSVLGIEPETWEPWHGLAVERLFAWMSTPALSDTLVPAAQDGLAMIRERTSRLRTFVGGGNIGHSAAWVAPDGGSRRLFARFVHGSASEPYVDEHLVVLGGDTIAIASVPGSPIVLAGASAAHAWAMLPHSSIGIDEMPADTNRLPLVHDRIVDRSGNEYLVSYRRSSEGLEIGGGIALDPVPDTVGVYFERPVSYRLTWRGFGPVSDFGAWRALLRGERPTFSLFDGQGIILQGESAALLGPDDAAFVTAGSVSAVGHPAWISSIAQSVSTFIQEEQESDAHVFDETRSSWAESIAPDMIAAARSIPEPPRPVRDALTYLRNWDYRYDDANIAATIFDLWVGRYRDSTGVDPQITAADTFFTERHRRYRTLVEAVDHLTEAFGTSMSQWRWENVMQDQRHSPGWPPPERFDGARRSRRFTTIDFPGHGHPGAPSFGPSPLDGMNQGSAVWEGVLTPGPQVDVRRRVVDMRSFLGRYMVSDRPPSFVRLGDIRSDRRTILSASAD